LVPADQHRPSLATFEDYALRFAIEESFLDDKSAGFQLASSEIADADALTHLCLILATATLYLVSTGTAIHAMNLRSLVDTHWQRGLSDFQLGWRWIRFALATAARLLFFIWLEPGPHPELVFASRAQANRSPFAFSEIHFSILDGLLHKVGLLQEEETHPLAGKMFALLDIRTRLPTQLWYEEDAQAHDQSFLEKVRSNLPVGSLLIFDLGFTNFRFFRQLSEQGMFFITRAKSNLAFQVERVLLKTAVVHDQIVWIDQGVDRQQLRLITFLYQGKRYRYLTNDLDPTHLPVEYAVALYWQRWRIEDGYAIIVKRLLGLAFFHCAQNAVQPQLWATWILYAILVDLTDEVAQQLNKPFARISMEMVYRSLPFFTRVHHRGVADARIPYLVANADRLDLVKHIRSDKPSILRSLQLTMIQNS
jgi:hypothetical protein